MAMSGSGSTKGMASGLIEKVKQQAKLPGGVRFRQYVDIDNGQELPATREWKKGKVDILRCGDQYLLNAPMELKREQIRDLIAVARAVLE